MDKLTMCDSPRLWESIHTICHPYKDVSVVNIVLEILFISELLWDHGYLYHDALFSIHVNIQVKIFDVHAHVL